MSQMIADAQDAPQRVEKLLSSDQSAYADLGKRLRALNPAIAATVARGSSDHAATYASYLIPFCTGKIVASIAPSLVTVLNAPLNLERQFVLAVSQGGRSPDIIATVERVKKSQALTAAIVNDVESPVAKMVDILLPQHAGVEGIAATKSVLCTLTAMARLTAEWTEDRMFQAQLKTLPGILQKAFTAGLDLDENILEGVSSAYVLSRGLGLSAAYEVALKLKETCGVHAEAFSTAEVRHGPREIVDQSFLIIALALPGSGRDDVLATAQEMKAQGARVMLIDLQNIVEARDPRISPLVVLQLLYPWLARASKALGHDPDHPRTLKSKVIQTL